MGFDVKKLSVNTGTYKVSGKTLAEVWADIQKKGPKDGAKRFAGSCDCNSAYSVSQFDFESAGEGKVKTWIKKGVLGYNCDILTPKASDARSFSKTAKKEWDRYLAAVMVHEKGHVPVYHTELVSVAKELAQKKVEGQGKDERAAKKAAVKAHKAMLDAFFKSPDQKTRLDKASKKYDKKTNHGASQGATLKTNVK